MSKHLQINIFFNNTVMAEQQFERADGKTRKRAVCVVALPLVTERKCD